ncbi:hypothetical protein E6O75_ATG10619 [Venturia nashicola]|uniref:Uncharacterized protein n=1 Tax=Venturia nashicola TaxID=86259 RepID=A0A4Z1P2A4_9PEZI|nr:hypothetical protein E6O75_ATG10619 [Venturia nashicola]
MEGDEYSTVPSSPPPKRPHGGPWGLQPYIPPPPRPYIAPRNDEGQARQRRRLLFKFQTKMGKSKYSRLIKKLGVDRRGRKMCSGEDGESSADTREESEEESLWERAERLGQMSLETTEEAPMAHKTRTGYGAPAPQRERSLSTSSGSSEEEPLMAWKKAKKEHSD